MFYLVLFSKKSNIAKAKHPATAMAQPTTFSKGNVSPAMKKYRATKIATRFKVLPTAVGTGPSVERMMRRYGRVSED